MTTSGGLAWFRAATARTAKSRVAPLALAPVAAAVAALLALSPDDAPAQRGGRFPRGFRQMLGDANDFYTPPDFAGNPAYDGRFTFARIKYRGYGYWAGRQGPGWSHDYPNADVHFMKIIREITTMRPFTNAGPIIGGAIVALDDPQLFKYPVAYLSEPGGWFPNADEVRGLHDYLAKGGFLIADDFPCEAWGTFTAAIGKAMPGLQPIRMTGDEPIFDAFYKVDLDKVNHGYAGGGAGCRRDFFGYFEDNDPQKRLVVLAAYGNDIGESWEWSGTGWQAVDVTNEAFKIGINFIVYALTH